MRGQGRTRVVRSNREMATVLGVRNEDGTVTVERVLKSVPVRSRAGRLDKWQAGLPSVEKGRRRMSPWQARAVGSGRGVLAREDTVFTSSPGPMVGTVPAQCVVPEFPTFDRTPTREEMRRSAAREARRQERVAA
jgi:hypothetical protein